MEKQYIVVREWKTTNRMNRLAAGSFRTRSKAENYVRVIRRMVPPDNDLYVVLFRDVINDGNIAK